MPPKKGKKQAKVLDQEPALETVQEEPKEEVVPTPEEPPEPPKAAETPKEPEPRHMVLYVPTQITKREWLQQSLKELESPASEVSPQSPLTYSYSRQRQQCATSRTD